jgi:hypothetical protein
VSDLAGKTLSRNLERHIAGLGDVLDLEAAAA